MLQPTKKQPEKVPFEFSSGCRYKPKEEIGFDTRMHGCRGDFGIAVDPLETVAHSLTHYPFAALVKGFEKL